MTYTLFFDIHSTKIRFQSDDAGFSSFAEKNLYFFKCEPVKNADIEITFKNRFVSVIARSDSDEAISERKIARNDEKMLSSLGVKVYQKTGSYNFEFPGMHGFNMKINNLNGQLKIESSMDRNVPFPFDLLLMNSSDRHNLFHSILRNLIFYPIFWHKENIENFLLLHAGAISVNDNGYLFFGLPGSGKSVVSLLSVLNLNAKFLSDNLVLAKEGFIYAFPELVRLSVDQTLIKKDAFEEVDIYIKGKQFYRMNEAKVADKAKIKKMFLLSIGCDKSVKKIDLSEFIKKALLVDACTKELQEYAVINLLNFADTGFIQRHEKMASCFKGIDAYELCLKKGDIDLDFLRERLK